MGLQLNAYPKIGNKVLIALSGLNRDSKLDEGGYQYDRHQYHISDRFLAFNWSKSLIKQLIIYVASSNSEGVISVISENDIAEAMGVSVRTIQHNNHQMVKAGILEWDRVFSDVITVSFTHYYYDILGLETEGEGEKEDQSTGFTYLDEKTIYALLKEEDVNILRTALRFFALAETQFNGSSKAAEFHVYYKDLTNFLPKYVGYKAKIKEICSKVQKFIPIKIVEGTNEVMDFLRNQRITKSVVQKAKDTLVYVVKKDEVTPPATKRMNDTYEFLADFFDFKNKAIRYRLPASENIHLHRDDASSLITSFGLSKLRSALARLIDLLEKYDLNPSKITSDEYFFLHSFYESPSKGLRYLATR